MRNTMAMVLGILLVMASGCITNATPDPNEVIQASLGDSIDFQVFGFTDETLFKPIYITMETHWEIAEMEGEQEPTIWQWDEVQVGGRPMEGSIYTLVVDPENEETDTIWVRCTLYTYALEGTGPSCPEPSCWYMAPTPFKRTWKVKVIR